MMAPIPSGSAPFLQFADAVPSWTSRQAPECFQNDHTDNTSACGEATVDISIAQQRSISSLSNASLSSADSSGCDIISTWTESPTSAASDDVCPSNNNSMVDHSSLIREARLLPPFKHLESQILQDFRNKKIYLFLDYDGTLTPIVPDPSQAILSNQMRSLLFNLANSDQVTIGIVTGRALSSIKRFVQISATEQLKFLYAASHGFHIEAAGRQLHHKVGARYIPILREAALKISHALGHIPGVVLEDNEFAVSVHYR